MHSTMLGGQPSDTTKSIFSSSLSFSHRMTLMFLKLLSCRLLLLFGLLVVFSSQNIVIAEGYGGSESTTTAIRTGNNNSLSTSSSSSSSSSSHRPLRDGETIIVQDKDKEGNKKTTEGSLDGSWNHHPQQQQQKQKQQQRRNNSSQHLRKQRQFIIHIINLDKDTKRWERVTSGLQQQQQQHDGRTVPFFWKNNKSSKKNAVVQIHRLPAIYGKNLTKKQLQANTTFVACHFLTKGTIGCYLSHRNFWEQVISANNNNPATNKEYYHICFEDDVVLADDVVDLDTLIQRLNYILDELEEEAEKNASTSSSLPSSSYDWDVIFLGALGCVHPEGKYGWNRIAAFFAGGGRKPKQVTSNLYIPRRPLGAHAYMLSNQGAQKLLNKAWTASGHVDVVAWKLPDLKVYCIHPMLLYQGMEEQSTIGAVTRGVETNLPKLVLDDYTKIRFEWVFNAPVLRFGSFLLTMGRSVSYIVGGYILAWLLRDKFPWLLPVHSITFAILFVLTKLTTIPCRRR